MAKRFSDTEKWKKKWFRNLSPINKVFWEYLRDNCNHAGIWDVDFDLAQWQIGAELNQLEITRVFKEHIIALSNKKWFLIDFIPYQYNCTIEELNPANRVHKSVLACLKKYNTKKGLTSSFDTPAQGVLDIDKDKDKDKEQEKVVKKVVKIQEQINGENILPFFGDKDFQLAWKEHRTVRTKKKGALTPRADTHILKELSVFCKGSMIEAIAILDKSARKGWVDVYELSKKDGKKEYVGALYKCVVCDEEYKYRAEGPHRCTNRTGKCEGWTNSEGENRRDPTLTFVKSIYREIK